MDCRYRCLCLKIETLLEKDFGELSDEFVRPHLSGGISNYSNAFVGHPEFLLSFLSRVKVVFQFWNILDDCMCRCRGPFEPSQIVICINRINEAEITVDLIFLAKRVESGRMSVFEARHLDCLFNVICFCPMRPMLIGS